MNLGTRSRSSRGSPNIDPSVSLSNDENFFTEDSNYNDFGAHHSSSAQFESNSVHSADFSVDNNSAGFDFPTRTDEIKSNFDEQSFRSEINATPLFHDPNPQIIRRPARAGVLTYTQNIQIRFLQPPPLPPPGVR